MSTQEGFESTPSLFDPPPPVTVTVAKDFVKWCCSFGHGFHNSPDIANLRYWARKSKLKIKEREEAAVLEVARTLFLKRIEHLTRKSEPAN
jgi:hypothetical protein